MNKIIYSTKNHPLYEKLSKLEGFSKEIPKSSDSLLLDFSASSSAEKSNLFTNYKGPILSDLSLNNGELLMSSHENVKASFAAVFPSPKNTYEAFYKENTYKEALINIFKELESNLLEVSTPGIGFIFPRTIAQIINEAWFALEDELATEKAIDTAMLFGVNYPLGPLDWGRKAGYSNTILLLEELYKTTNQDRYKVCSKLEKAHR